MKKWVLILLTLSVPAMLFLSVFQVYRYQQLEKEVALLRESQQELFEKNKRMIANIAILSSPKRIARLARETLHLVRKDDGESVFRIVFDQEKEGPDG
jgi:cell division protein FtsL